MGTGMYTLYMYLSHHKDPPYLYVEGQHFINIKEPSHNEIFHDLSIAKYPSPFIYIILVQRLKYKTSINKIAQVKNVGCSHLATKFILMQLYCIENLYSIFIVNRHD